MSAIVLLPLLFCAAFADNEFTAANNFFTNSVYKEVAKTQEGNLLVSPFSAEVILALAQSGAVGETREELRHALHLPNDTSKVEAAVKAVLPKLRSSHHYTLLSANKVYIKPGFSIKDGFKKSATDVYLADTEFLNFAQSDQAAKTMNQWVEKQTKDKIKNLISSTDLNQYTRSVLINALYFKASWAVPFEASATRKLDFYTPTATIKVDTLHHPEVHFKFYECPHLRAQFLELPFKKNAASLVIVLPLERTGISRLEQNLDQVFAPQHHLVSQLVNVALKN